MGDASIDLVPIWTTIIAFGVFFYVLLDGFDLGVGILYGFAPEIGPRHRDECHRTRLGRQRDLAHPRRTGAACGVSARLRDHHPGGVFPDHC